MPTRKDEAVASHPLWVAGVVSQMTRPQGKGHRGGSHWKSRMTRIGLLDGIRRKKSKGVDGTSLKACTELVEGVVCHVCNLFI